VTSLWTDGSSGKSGKMGWAVVGELRGQQVRLCGWGDGTNQVAELTAAISAMECLPDGEPAYILADSEYVIKSCTEWRSNWEENGFTNYSGATISNLGLIQRLHANYDRLRVTFLHVRGHTGEEGNELADALAHAARFVAEGKISKDELEAYLVEFQA
jgi:ribonuclease HI